MSLGCKITENRVGMLRVQKKFTCIFYNSSVGQALIRNPSYSS